MKKFLVHFFVIVLSINASAQQSPTGGKPVVIPPKIEKPDFPKGTRRDIPIPRDTKTEVDKFNFNGDEIWLYEHINYQGEKKVIKKNQSYTLSQLGFNWNDKISSILIPVNRQGYYKFYRHDNFQGGYLQLQNLGDLVIVPNPGQYPDLSQLKINRLTNVFNDPEWGDNYKTEGSYNDVISSISIKNF